MLNFFSKEFTPLPPHKKNTYPSCTRGCSGCLPAVLTRLSPPPPTLTALAVRMGIGGWGWLRFSRFLETLALSLTTPPFRRCVCGWEGWRGCGLFFCTSPPSLHPPTTLHCEWCGGTSPRWTGLSPTLHPLAYLTWCGWGLWWSGGFFENE